MDGSTITHIAKKAAEAENLAWTVSRVAPDPAEPAVWEVYYDAPGRKAHLILIRLSPGKDSTAETLEAELRARLLELRESGRL